MEWVFEVSAERLRAIPQEELLGQAARALEARTEQQARRQMPGLWKVTDKLRGLPKASKETQTNRRTRRTLWSVLCLVLGIFVLVPGLVEPRRPSLIFVGAASVCVGLSHLFLSRKKPKDLFTEPARKLLAPLYALPEGSTVRACFTEDGMALETIGTDDRRQTASYPDFECVIESDSLFLLIYNGNAAALPKYCFLGDELNGLRALLSSKTTLLRAGSPGNAAQ